MGLLREIVDLNRIEIVISFGEGLQYGLGDLV